MLTLERKLSSPKIGMLLFVLFVGVWFAAPGGSAFWSQKLVSTEILGLILAMWAAARMRRRSGFGIAVYPLMVGGIVAVTILAKLAGSA